MSTSTTGAARETVTRAYGSTVDDHPDGRALVSLALVQLPPSVTGGPVEWTLQTTIMRRGHAPTVARTVAIQYRDIAEGVYLSMVELIRAQRAAAH